VDDEQVVLTSLVSQLEQLFDDTFDYEAFTDPEEAFEFIDELFAEGEELELIICDWLMPKVRGDEFLVRVHKRYPKVPMIMLSGQADDSAVQRARTEANLFRFIAKPWSKEELADSVRQATSLA
jgi:CheY-like chemotaxis protein